MTRFKMKTICSKTISNYAILTFEINYIFNFVISSFVTIPLKFKSFENTSTLPYAAKLVICSNINEGSPPQFFNFNRNRPNHIQTHLNYIFCNEYYNNNNNKVIIKHSPINFFLRYRYFQMHFVTN